MDGLNAGLAVLHIATGTFYTTTGARKCFLPEVRTKFSGFLSHFGLPKPAICAVMGGEFLGGLGILTGCLTHVAAAGLLIIMGGAFKLDTFPAIKAKQTGHWSQYLSNLLCTAESQLLVILTVLALTGAGSVSIDHFLWR